MSERPWLSRYVWWHRWKRHSVIRGFGLLAPMSAWKCEDCDRIWTWSLI